MVGPGLLDTSTLVDSGMRMWVVLYEPASFSEELYLGALNLVDIDSMARVKKFYRREDACRCLIGRLLPRMLLKQRGVTCRAMSFASTETGKPYINTPGLQPPIAYNITHDNGVVAMAYACGSHGSPDFRIGVDVMKVKLPERTTFTSFVQSMSEQLTPLEIDTLFDNVSQDEGLCRFYWIWTLKEAYSKALGVGLGFNFRRIEYDIPHSTVKVDGKVPKGWQFSKFELGDASDAYEGVVAEFVGGDDTTFSSRPQSEWIAHYATKEFVQRAHETLI